jgi:2-(1,2-epoxy-1,2-dihydrophenyl)acetyl-CoA isomerase
MNEAFQLHATGGVLTVAFNRPERLNAFRRAEYHRFRDLLADIEDDPSVCAIVLTGSGRGFCAGEDLKELDASVAEAPSVTRENALVLQDITRRIVRSRLVYIAAVNGVAAGFAPRRATCPGGRWGAPSFEVRGLHHQRIRMMPPAGDNGRRRSSGDPIDAATALRIDWPCSSFPRRTVAAASGGGHGCGNAPSAVQHTKQILRGNGDALEHALAQEVEYLERVLATGEYLEGARAFVEKRPPRFGERGR